MEDKILKHEMSDLELVRRSMQMAQRSNHALSPPGMSLENTELRKKNAEEQEKACTKREMDAFEKGYQMLYQLVSEQSLDGIYSKSEEIAPIPLEKFQIKQEILDSIKQLIAGHKSEAGLFQKCGFSNQILLVFYEFGMRLYEEAFYEKSILALTFLTTVHPSIPSFWLSLGLSYEKNLNFTEALKAYEKAIEIDPSVFSPYFGLIRCGEEIKDFSKAIEVLESHKNIESIKENVEIGLIYIREKK
jgi:tetratricopeptide (TPR) repeat protein